MSDDECIEYDTCERCEKYVLVDFISSSGYTITDCEYTGDMCCRACLDKRADEEEAAEVIQKFFKKREN